MDEIAAADWKHFLRLFESMGAAFEPHSHLKRDLETYLKLLLTMNESVNLTSITDFQEAVWKHLYDSLLLVSMEPLGSVLDWGTGGGTPGIPLALYRRALADSCAVDFLDSVKKKARCVEEMLHALGLGFSRVYEERGETFILSHVYDSVVMRAVAPPARAIPWMHGSAERFVFMTGPKQVADWEAALSEVRARGFRLADHKEFVLPFSHGERHILSFRRI